MRRLCALVAQTSYVPDVFFGKRKKLSVFKKYPDTRGECLRQLTEGICPRNCTLNAIVGFCLDQF